MRKIKEWLTSIEADTICVFLMFLGFFIMMVVISIAIILGTAL